MKGKKIYMHICKNIHIDLQYGTATVCGGGVWVPYPRSYVVRGCLPLIGSPKANFS